MASTFTRLTLYALITAIEQDLRDVIATYLAPQLQAENLLGTELLAACRRRLLADGMAERDTEQTVQLLMYVDFGDLVQILNKHRGLLAADIAGSIRSLTTTLGDLAAVRNRVMHSRPLEYDDLSKVMDAAAALRNLQEFQWEHLKSTEAELANDPSMVLRITIPSTEEPSRHYHNLPIPDFDETGFIGRRATVQQVTKACFGPYPVITIVGEGGVGKTALALKVAYDILDDERNSFDAIVWTSSKTTQLGTAEIRRVENAISDSLGVLSDVAGHVVGLTDDPFTDVLEQMRDFRIFLILDNLETILDARIRDFLGALPSGSKVLITSRIGVGAYEYPVKLTPLDEGEAVQLLRAVARARGVEALAKTANKNLQAYCHRMHNSPLHIKWFVSAVQAGARPEDALADNALFLEFCLSNVYIFLSSESRQVLDGLLYLGGQFTLPEIAFLAELTDLEARRAVQQLATTNMVTAISEPGKFTYETRYDLTPLTRGYLKRKHPLADHEVRRFMGRKQQLVAAGEKLRARSESEPDSIFNIHMRSRSDWVIAKYLVDALAKLRASDYTAAEELVARAKGLAPDYFEVFRVEGWVQAEQGNLGAANAAYEAALELSPDSLSLRLLYGGFLLRSFNDTEAAISQFRAAREIDRSSVEAAVELARALLFQMNFDGAKTLLDEASGRLDLAGRTKRILEDLRLQFYRRRADRWIELHKYDAALADLSEFVTLFGQLAVPDRLMQNQLAKVQDSVGILCGVGDDVFKEAARTLYERVQKAASGGVRRYLPSGRISSGAIYSLPARNDFGFIVGTNNEQYFFHQRDLINATDWATLRVGQPVEFEAAQGRNGLMARRVRLLGVRNGLEPLDLKHQGKVLRVLLEKNFGFLQTTSGEDFFFTGRLWRQVSTGHFSEREIVSSSRSVTAKMADARRFRFALLRSLHCTRVSKADASDDCRGIWASRELGSSSSSHAKR